MGNKESRLDNKQGLFRELVTRKIRRTAEVLPWDFERSAIDCNKGGGC